MKPDFFYSATRARKSRFVPLEDAYEMFAQLDNGNLSDVWDDEDNGEDDDLIFEGTGDDDGVLCTLETSDESDEEQPHIKKRHGAEKCSGNHQLVLVEVPTKMSPVWMIC